MALQTQQPPNQPLYKPVKSVKPFPVQAAQFSLYAPLVCFLLVLGTNTLNKADPRISPYIGAFNLLLLLAGFALGIVALVLRGTHSGVLVRAVIGVALNSFFLAAAFLTIFPLFLERSRDAHTAAGLPGAWVTVRHPGLPDSTNMTLTLNPDKTFHYTSSGGANADFDGIWSVYHAQLLMKVQRLPIGNPQVVNKVLPLTIRSHSENALIVIDGPDIETFTRR